MTIRDIYKQDSECERLIEELNGLQLYCNEDPFETEISYLTLEDLKACIEKFREYIALIGNLDVYNLISDRLGRKV